MSANEHAQPRPIRSFVLRQGRVSNAQRHAYDEGMPRFGIAYQPSPLDLDAAFGRTAPKVLEIGFGMGETTAAIAKAHPDHDYLALEVHTPGVGALLKLLDEQHLTNVRIIQHDAIEVLEHMLAPQSLDRVHIFFPDPWPKKRHHKRRLIRPEFVSLLVTRLKPGAILHLATDWADYAEQMLAVLCAERQLENCAPGFAQRPESRPMTKFEQRGMRLGHRVYDLMVRKRT